MAFAGLWEGARRPAGDIMRTFGIITTAANDGVAELHNRIPVMPEPEHAMRRRALAVRRASPVFCRTSGRRYQRITRPCERTSCRSRYRTASFWTSFLCCPFLVPACPPVHTGRACRHFRPTGAMSRVPNLADQTPWVVLRSRLALATPVLDEARVASADARLALVPSGRPEPRQCRRALGEREVPHLYAGNVIGHELRDWREG
jgi:SOS response associated peptidase (SRAP)